MRKLLGMLFFFTFLFALLSAGTPVLAQSTCGKEYVVVRGDSLSKIARRCGTTTSALLEANATITNPNKIKVGQRIVLEPALNGPALSITPKTVTQGSEIEIQVKGFPAMSSVQYFLAPKPESGEPEFELLKTIRADESGAAGIQTTLPENVSQGEWIVAASPRHRQRDSQMLTQSILVVTSSDLPLVHIVQRGERLSRIASRYDTNVTSIMKKNTDIVNPNRILVGQEILIPGPDEQYPDEPFMPVAANPKVDVESIVGNHVKENERWIDVDLSAQTVHAYEGSELVRSFLVSTGKARTPTVTGQYRIYIKLTKTDMRGPGYHLRDVPYTMYFHKGYGLHGTYWHDNFGTPMSNGCVNMQTEDAQWLFDFASVDTLVNVHH